MIEITNKGAGPIPILVKSKKKTRSFTTLIIPGRGSGQNVKVIEDELYTKYIDRAVQLGLITKRTFTNK